MSETRASGTLNRKRLVAMLVLLSLILLAPVTTFADKKKKTDEPKKSSGNRLFQYRLAESPGDCANPLPSLLFGAETLAG